MFAGGPNDLFADSGIVMYQDISHINDISKWDIGVCCLKACAQVICRLSNEGQLSNNCINHHVVFREFLEVSIRKILFNLGNCISNMLEV